MALSFTYVETKTVQSVSNFTPELIEEFNSAWGFLKENPSHSATVIFENAEKRDKWFNLAKAYGAQHPDKVFVSKVKGSGSDSKTTGKLVFKMEAGAQREERIAAQKARNEIYETLREHGIEYKRGVGSNVDALYAKLMKMSPEERQKLHEKHAKATAANSTPAATSPTPPKPIPTPIPAPADKGKNPAKP